MVQIQTALPGRARNIIADAVVVNPQLIEADDPGQCGIVRPCRLLVFLVGEDEGNARVLERQIFLTAMRCDGRSTVSARSVDVPSSTPQRSPASDVFIHEMNIRQRYSSDRRYRRLKNVMYQEGDSFVCVTLPAEFASDNFVDVELHLVEVKLVDRCIQSAELDTQFQSTHVVIICCKNAVEAQSTQSYFPMRP